MNQIMVIVVVIYVDWYIEIYFIVCSVGLFFMKILSNVGVV